MRPANQAPTAQPINAEATANPSRNGPVSNCSPIALTAPLMTAVSKPNRKPPRAAVAATRTTLAIGTVTLSSDVWAELMAVLLGEAPRDEQACPPAAHPVAHRAPMSRPGGPGRPT